MLQSQASYFRASTYRCLSKYNLIISSEKQQYKKKENKQGEEFQLTNFRLRAKVCELQRM